MLKAVHLRCEYLENPVGIDRNPPKLSWHLDGEGKYQTAYEIAAAHTEEELKAGNYIWNSGKVLSDSMVRNAYGCQAANCISLPVVSMKPESMERKQGIRCSHRD